MSINYKTEAGGLGLQDYHDRNGGVNDFLYCDSYHELDS